MKLSLRLKIGLLILIPTFMMVLLGLIMILRAQSNVRSLENLSDLLVLLRKFGEIEYNLNLEKGHYINYMLDNPNFTRRTASEKAKLKEELFGNTDATIADFESLLNNLDFSGFEKGLKSTFEDLHREVKKIKDYRATLNDGIVDSDEWDRIREYYEKLTDQTITVFPYLTREARSNEVAQKMVAYHMAKEVETVLLRLRGMVFWAVQVDALPLRDGVIRMNALYEKEQACFERLIGFSNPEKRAEVIEFMEDSRFIEGTGYLVDIMYKGTAGGYDLTNELDYEPIWEYLETFSYLVDSYQEEVDETIAAHVGEVVTERNLTVMGLLAVLGLSFGITYVSSRRISGTLHGVMVGLHENSSLVATSAEQIDRASHTLADGASQQAAGFEETTAALHELSQQTSQTAEHSSEAEAHMQKTYKVVHRQTQIMQDLTSAMRSISETGNKTKQIVKTIDEIAFQTNILALNAAVEAARAGEHGAGFAVVADEVRNLAQRAAESARNTTALIDESNQTIATGVKLVQDSDASIKELSQEAEQARTLFGQVAAHAREQAAGIKEINTTSGNMDQLTQNNAAAAEECSASAQELRGMASRLDQTIAHLGTMLGESHSNSGTPSARPKTHKGKLLQNKGNATRSASKPALPGFFKG